MMYSEKITVCFTGHRLQKLPFGFNEEDPKCIKMKRMLCRKIEDLIVNHGASHFISGMAIGVDMICGEIVLELKNEHPHITLECAIPCRSQPDRWSKEMKDRYYSVLNQSDCKTVLQEHYTADCMHKRNEYMVEKSEIVIAVWDGSSSGTGYTVNIAKEKGKKIYVLNPEKL